MSCDKSSKSDEGSKNIDNPEEQPMRMKKLRDSLS